MEVGSTEKEELCERITILKECEKKKDAIECFATLSYIIQKQYIDSRLIEVV